MCQKGHIPLRGKLTAPAAAFSQTMCTAQVEDINLAVAAEIFDANPVKRVRTVDDLAKEAAQRLEPGGIHTKHLSCP